MGAWNNMEKEAKGDLKQDRILSAGAPGRRQGARSGLRHPLTPQHGSGAQSADLQRQSGRPVGRRGTGGLSRDVGPGPAGRGAAARGGAAGPGGRGAARRGGSAIFAARRGAAMSSRLGRDDSGTGGARRPREPPEQELQRRREQRRRRHDAQQLQQLKHLESL
ncbi:hypothetical protein J1605_009768 [Eschrichtius robustus]|uniref:Uncharacterized protein n=1 Tax=Eschrichtius robustus TaxID=9764 RepID=A0AB34GWZ9_ESCRO|nr:hypothetical protein J1605_009768 [Eschrichtius robustus]